MGLTEFVRGGNKYMGRLSIEVILLITLSCMVFTVVSWIMV